MQTLQTQRKSTNFLRPNVYNAIQQNNQAIQMKISKNILFADEPSFDTEIIPEYFDFG